MKKVVIGVGIFAASLGLFVTQAYAAKDYVYIPNSGIRRDIKENLTNLDILVENELPEKTMFDQLNSIDIIDDFWNRIQLTTSHDSAGSLEGVQYVKNLEILDINSTAEGNEIIDFRPLKDSVNLKVIHSYVYKESDSKTFITDISPLANLEKLERVELNEGHFLDLTPLEKSLAAGNLKSIKLSSSSKVLNLDSISVSREQNKYELVNPVKYPPSFKTMAGIDYTVTAYYTKDPVSYFYEAEYEGESLNSNLEEGVIKFPDIPADKSDFNYLLIKISAYKLDNSIPLFYNHSVTLSYPVHFY